MTEARADPVATILDTARRCYLANGISVTGMKEVAADAAAGARYLARGGQFRVYEGDYQPRRLVLLEFPSLEVVDEFYESAGYQAIEAQRQACSSARIIAVEGL